MISRKKKGERKKEQTHISLWEWGEEEGNEVSQVMSLFLALLLDKLIRLADN